MIHQPEAYAEKPYPCHYKEGITCHKDVCANCDYIPTILLTDEENPYNNPTDREREEDGMLSKYEIFGAGAQVQLRKVVEWIEAHSFDHLPQDNVEIEREDWQALIEEEK